MLDVSREIAKFRPLPVTGEPVPPLGATAALWQELSKSLHDLGLAQLRTAAELTNLIQSRAESERSQVLAFLPVVDTFDLAYDAIVLLGDPTWKEQFDTFRDTVTKQLEAMGLSHVPGVGHPFDPEVHEEAAVVSRLDAEWSTFETDTVGALYQRGFFWKGQLLRRAQVVRVR